MSSVRMPVSAPQRPATRRGRSLLVALVAVIAVLCSTVSAASPAQADDIVRFDGAGEAARIGLIGDSTLAGVRWYADYGALRSYNFVLTGESCRRTIEPSCISREGFRSDNVITAMRSLVGELGEVLVVMSGYNDPVETIDEAIVAVVDEAQSQGVDHVVWLTLRTSSDVDYSDPQEQSSINTFRAYNEQLVDAAAASDGYLQVADWATYSNGATAWFETDGVHLTPSGVDALTGFIASVVQRVLGGDDVSPAAAPWTVLVPGATGDDVAAVQEAIAAAGVDVPGGADGVYGNDTMAAVAEYQRRDGGLQVTGAVDLATARTLGVYVDPNDTSSDTPISPVVDAPALAVPQEGDIDAVADPDVRPAGGGVSVWLVVVAVSSVLGLIVVARRRYVVMQRAARRRARIHPSASPHRSVADLRRSGELPAVHLGADEMAPTSEPSEERSGQSTH